MKIKDELLQDIVTDKMGEYSTYVLLSRAIPDIRDGLKPSYRRILWTMKQMKANKFTKSANIAGEVMRYHPHGSTYATMVGMAQTDAQLNPYLMGKGNFGNHSSELAFASDRYTELKLSKISIEMMSDTNKNGVEMIDNYDGTRKIPEAFPVKYPSILAYAQSGIGVGFSSSIPSFNITELCEATIKYIDKKEKTMLVPDFGTGARVIEDRKIVRRINEEGSGSIKQRALAKIDGKEIIITEIPYGTTKEKIIDRIIKLNKQGKLNDVKNIEDLSGLKGMEIIITGKRSADMEVLLERLYQTTPMESSYSSNMMVINNKGLPEKMGVWKIIDEWLVWRRSVVNNMLIHDTKIQKRNLEILNGLEIIKDDINSVIATIRRSSDKEVEPNLVKEYGLSPLQAERIAGLKLRNLSTTFIKKQLKAIKKTEKVIKDNKKAIKSDKLKDKMIVSDLERTIDEFGQERHSEIIKKSKIKAKKDIVPITPEHEDYNVRVFVTRENYVKKIPLTSLRGNFDIVTKQSDEVINEVETTNLEEILIFTDKQNVYKERLYNLPDSKPSDLGNYIPSEIDLEKDEQILHIAPLNSEHLGILIGYEDGKVAVIDEQSYRTKQNRSVLRGGFADKTTLLFKAITENVDLMAISDDDKVVLINTDIISPKATRTTKGNNFIKLRKDAKVKEYIINPDIEDKEYYRVKSAGVGKYIKE